jgi:hypothetical protein
VADRSLLFKGSIIPGKLASTFIEFIKAVTGAYPEVAGIVFCNGKYELIADGSGIVLVVFPGFEVLTIEAVEAILCADPDEAIAVLVNGVYAALGEAVGYVPGNETLLSCMHRQGQEHAGMQ